MTDLSPIERLNTIEPPPNREVEAAIHLARYAAALPHCRGKHVLDAACGEGYGARLLADSGAAYVDAVDISEDAIRRARQSFQTDRLTFHCADVERLSSLFPPRRFDLVVSLETIEHLASPAAFLQELRKVAAADATFIISCPNDHFYYPDGAQGNPFHVRKYSFDEFKDLATSVLGPNVCWSLGSSAFGFATAPYPSERSPAAPLASQSWINARPQQAGLMLPSPGKAEIRPENCSYFVGIWGPAQGSSATSAVFPLSMQPYQACFDAIFRPERRRQEEEEHRLTVASLREEAGGLMQRLQETGSENIRLQTELQRQTDALRERIGELECVTDRLQTDKDAAEKLAARRNLQLAALQKEAEILREAVIELQAACRAHPAQADSAPATDAASSELQHLRARDAELLALEKATIEDAYKWRSLVRLLQRFVPLPLFRAIKAAARRIMR